MTKSVAAVYDRRPLSNSFCPTMTISLNGKPVDTREAKTIAELIDRYQLPPQSILVEHNGLAVHRHEWAD